MLRLLLPLWFVLSLYSQSNLASLNGVICDPQKRPIEASVAELKSTSMGISRMLTTDQSGTFDFAGLNPGEYDLTAHAPGFSEVRRRLVLEVGQQMRLDVELPLGTTREDLQVVGFAEVLKTNEASMGEVVEQKSIQDLPLNGRILLDLALTVPGSHIGHGAQTGDMNPLYWRPGQASAITIGGNRPNANYFLLDGTTNTDPTFNTQNISLSPDAVLEFKVQTGSYSAEMGGAGGGQINIATRSGTTQFHGTGYEYLRNNAMDARNYNEMPGSSRLAQNNFGVALGGPIQKEKTFFFVNYEGLRRTAADAAIATVPTGAEKAGDFSNAGVNIFNPFSSHTNPNFDPSKPAGPLNPRLIRDPFEGNQIPAELISPVAGTMLNRYVPNPNMMGGMGMGMTMMGVPLVVGSGVDSNNYLDVRDEHHEQNQGTVRIDHVFGSGDTAFGRYSIGTESGFMPQNLPGFGAYHDNRSQQAVVSWNHIVSTSLVNSASVAMSRLAMHRSSENSEGNDVVSELGIQGVGFGGKGAFGAPYFNVQGYSGMGDTFAATPMKAWDTLLEAREALSWQHGRHEFKFGGSSRRYIWPMWGFFQNRGYYQFTNGFTTQTATNDGSGSALASFELGLPAVRQRQAGTPSMNLRSWSADAYAQDSWRITSNTTLEMGLRYEFMMPLEDISRPWSNLLVEGGQFRVFIGGQDGLPRGLMYANKLQLAPRFGIAHQIPSAGFVVRAAYGIFYTPVDLNTWCNQLHNVPYVFPETNQSDNFVPSINSFNFNPAVLGKTVVSFASFDPHAPSQYVEQWSGSVQKSLGKQTTLEMGYQGARGLHLQRAHLINNAAPGPGVIQPRRPHQTASFVDGTVLPDNIAVASPTFTVSSVNLLENTARSWYDAGYINVRRRYSRGLSLLANYTFAKNLTDAPDFRSPMFESSVAQNNNDLSAEKGPGCDIRQRLALSMVYEVPAFRRWTWGRLATEDWRISTIYQAQSGFPLTISVFGDTANAGTVLGENPVRANYTGEPVFGPGTRTSQEWFNTEAFAAPAAYTFGNLGRNTVYGPGMQTVDLALDREFRIRETARITLRAEVFNGLNHTNLGMPDRFVNTPQFGTITEAATPNRQLQMSLRFSF